MKTRILYSCPLDPVRFAAPGYHVANVVNELINLGNDVMLVHQGGIFEGVQSEYQVALQLKRRSLIGRLSSDFFFLLGLKKQLNNKKYDWVYHRLEKGTILPLLLFKWLKIPTVLEINSDIPAELASQNKSWLLRKLYPLSERFQVNRSDRIVAVSQGIGQNLKKNHPHAANRVFIVENGSDVSTFFPRNRETSCLELRLDQDLRYIVFSGSLQAWQGLETLLDSVSAVVAQFPDVRFLIVGAGPLNEKLEKQVHDNGLSDFVVFKGWQVADKLALYLAASEICVAPYSSLAALNPDDLRSGADVALMKCSPLKIYTYMAMGKPVVASSFTDGGERLVRWDAGLSFPPDNVSELAKALLTLLGDKNYAKELGDNGLKRVRKRHTWGMVAREIEECMSLEIPI